MQSFNKSQTFFLDPNTVGGAPSVRISACDLFFQAKPDRTNNASGIKNPGVSIIVVPTIYGVPKIDNVQYTIARAEYDQIATTSDASLPTRFRFSTPVPVDTGKEYAIVIMFDGSENFVLWNSKVGDFLIDTKTISPGPSGKYIGKYYDYTNSPANFSAEDPTVINAALSQQQYQSSWTPLNDTDLKFRVYVARYASNGFAVSSNTNIPSNTQVITTPLLVDQTANNEVFLYPAQCLEILLFDQATSRKEAFVGGQWAYQNTFSYPGGFANGSSFVTVSCSGSDRVVANSTYPNGALFNWRSIYPSVGLSSTSNDSPYIVLRDSSGVNVRKVLTVVSNTIIQIDEPTSFVNSAAQFMVTPVGVVDSFNKGAPFGVFTSMVLLTNSSANSTLRFVNNSVQSANIVAGGSGYSNSDVLYVIGFENVVNKVIGGYSAVANLQTNSTGGIVAVYWSNIGCGFANASNMKLVFSAGANTNPSTNTSVGTGANVQLTMGSVVCTELRNNVFNGVRVANFALSDVIPFFDIDHPAGTSYDLKMTAQYYVQADAATISGYAYYVNDTASLETYPINMFVKNPFLGSRVPVYMSRSNEFVTGYANGGTNDKVVSGATTSNVICLIVNTSSNSDFLCVGINSIPTVSFSTYIVNNDYTNEHTDKGNAWARQITTLINFARPAEDVVVYLTAYKPSNTDIQVYARILNSTDPEAFDDKDWTRLQVNSICANLKSSPTNSSDMIELDYHLQAFPNTDLRLSGTITGANGSATITGINTSFNTQIASGDLIKISNPLFANTYMIDVVNAVTNSTSLVLNNPISNINFAVAGLVCDKISTYKHQAFNNYLNSNVARYYSTSMIPYDGYSSAQIKIVMLSDRPNLVPRIDDVRAIGVSA